MVWISHQRELDNEPLAARPVVYINLLFLLYVIALPITTGLYGTYGNARDIVVLYSCHLAVMGGLNAIPWASRRPAARSARQSRRADLHDRYLSCSGPRRINRPA